MLNKSNKPEVSSVTRIEDFNNSREEQNKLFKAGMGVFKRKIAQGLFWTAIDKDLADQYVRDERWFMGIKFYDTLKLIDHDVEDIVTENKIGFTKK